MAAMSLDRKRVSKPRYQLYLEQPDEGGNSQLDPTPGGSDVDLFNNPKSAM